MSMTGLSVFDTTLQKTNVWVNEVAQALGIDDKHKAFQWLRATLHTLRDRLPVEEATHLGAQLPILLSGFYYENWKPAATPTKDRSKEEFFVHMQDNYQGPEIDASSEQVARAVFRVLSNHVSEGEIRQIVSMMPPVLKDLWPEKVAR